MRFGWPLLARSVAVAAIIASSALTFAQQSSDTLVDITLNNADLIQAANMLTAKAGIDIVVEPSSEPWGRVTLKLDQEPVEDVIRYMCQAAGAYFRKDDNGVFIISHHPLVVNDPALPAAPQEKILKRIKLMKASAQDVWDQLKGRIPFEYKRGFDLLRAFHDSDPASLPFRHAGVSILPQNGTQTFAPINSPMSTPLTTSESGGQIQLPGEGGNQTGFGGGGGGGGQGGFGGGGGGGGGIGGQNGGGGGAGGAGNAQLVGGQGLVPDTIDFISYDPTDNSLIVRGTSYDDIRKLQNYVNEFDVAPRQVLIKVEFITTTTTLQKDLGYEFLYQRGTVLAGTTPGIFANSADPVFLNYATGNVAGRLRTQLVEGDGKVVEAPIVRTLNNQAAEVFSSIESYISESTNTITNGISIQGVTIYPLTASTDLSVAPRINTGDNTITMYLEPTVQNFVGFSQTLEGQIPNISTQAIEVVARVASGQTIVLGGLTNKTETNSENRVPVLSELPIIGQFFRSQSRAKSNSELLIFVTPTIIDDDSVGNTSGP